MGTPKDMQGARQGHDRGTLLKNGLTTLKKV